MSSACELVVFNLDSEATQECWSWLIEQLRHIASTNGSQQMLNGYRIFEVSLSLHTCRFIKESTWRAMADISHTLRNTIKLCGQYLLPSRRKLLQLLSPLASLLLNPLLEQSE